MGFSNQVPKEQHVGEYLEGFGNHSIQYKVACCVDIFLFWNDVVQSQASHEISGSFLY